MPAALCPSAAHAAQQHHRQLRLEAQVQRRLFHPSIARLFWTLETPETHFFVLERIKGGELFDFIVTHKRIKEPKARQLFRQVISAVAACHSQGVVHRDLKPENVLIDQCKSIKLTDFGLVATPLDLESELLTTSCGSIAYAAPEVISGKKYLGPPADMWSLGILLYAMLCGSLPFDDENEALLLRKVLQGKFSVPFFLSMESEAVIRGLLQLNPDKRLTMDELLRHPWVLMDADPDTIELDAAGQPTLRWQSAEPTIIEHLVDQVSETVRQDRDEVYRAILTNRGGESAAPEMSRAVLLYEMLCQLEQTETLRSQSQRGAAAEAAQERRNRMRKRSHTIVGSETPEQFQSPAPPAAGSGTRDARPSALQRIAEDFGRSRSDTSASEPASAAAATAALEARPLSDEMQELSLCAGPPRDARPALIQGIFSVVTSSAKAPVDVYADLIRVLTSEPSTIITEQGYTIGAQFSETLQVNFEVCIISGLNMTGIKPHRVEGNVREYTQACERVLSKLRL